MFLLLYGPDTYRLNQKLRAIWKRYQEVSPQGFRAYSWNQANLDIAEVQNALAIQSMFQEKTLLVFHNVLPHEQLDSFFQEHIERFASGKEFIIVFAQEGEVPQKDKRFQLLLNHAVLAQHFPLLQKEALSKWIQKTGARYGIQFDSRARAMMQEAARNDLWGLEQEIRKIAAFKNFQGTVTAKDIESLVSFSLDVNIFHALQAIASGNKKEAIKLLRTHQAKGDSPFQFFSMLVMQFRNLLLIREMQERGMTREEIGKQMGMHPYAFSKAYTQASAFSFDQLKAACKQLFEIDRKTKLGQADLSQAMELFALKV